MVLSVPLNTQAALAAAPTNGIAPRDFVWMKALNRDTEMIEEIGFWSGNVPVSAPIIQPDDGEDDTRDFIGMHGLMQVPAIPMTMKLEVRSIKVVFSNLSPDVINAALVYNAKGRAIQIFRGLLDPQTMNLVDPAVCRFDGYVNRIQIRRAKAGNDGQVVVECQSHARTLALSSPEKFSDEFFKRRGGRQPYLDIVPKIVWGQKDIIKEKRRPKKSKWIGE